LPLKLKNPVPASAKKSGECGLCKKPTVGAVPAVMSVMGCPPLGKTGELWQSTDGGSTWRFVPRSNARTPLKEATWRRNLSRRLPAPAKGNGRVQRQCRRALLAHDGPISTSVAICWSYRELMWGAPSKDSLSRAVRHALISIGAVKIARSPGRPWLWKLQEPTTVKFTMLGGYR
jgi:hypothetical protein